MYIGADESIGASLRLAWRAYRSADYLVFNIDHRRLLLTCALYWLIGPRPLRRCRIVSVDILLRPPRSLEARPAALLKRLLLKQVDTFLLYFRNTDGYTRHFGIPKERMTYVAFKVNSWEKLEARRGVIPEGDYVLLAGATLRDRATFVEAVREAGMPAVLLVPGDERAAVEQTAWYRAGLPPNLRLDYHTDGKEETYLGYHENARIVCLPRYKWDIASTGISSYLCAMGLGKCVVISRGPGAEDLLLENESAVFFEPENAEDLARVLKDAWERHEHRRRIAANGARYAKSLAGEERLLEDILAALGLPHGPGHRSVRI